MQVLQQNSLLHKSDPTPLWLVSTCDEDFFISRKKLDFISSLKNIAEYNGYPVQVSLIQFLVFFCENDVWMIVLNYFAQVN